MKTMLLPMQKSVAKNYNPTDSKIDSQTKTWVAVDSEINSDGGVISSFNLPFFCVYKRHGFSLFFQVPFEHGMT
jgi:hypothetical protein